MNKLQSLAMASLLLVSGAAFSQNAGTNSGGQVETVQPKIMVIPYVKEGEDLRTILERDADKRIAITKIKEAFDSRGFTTVDFTAKLKSAKESGVLNADNQTDIKTQIMEMSGADVYVQAEIISDRSQSGNSVKLILTAYEISTGNSLSNKVGESGRFYTDDYNKLASKAVESCADDFLNVMQSKFTDIVNNGKSIIIDIGISPGSAYTMSSEVGDEGLTLADEIELWMEANAFKNNYHTQGTTNVRMIFDDVHIPLRDQSTGNNYTPKKFGMEMYKFFRKLGIPVERSDQGSKLTITIK
jgi:hypothetical protein